MKIPRLDLSKVDAVCRREIQSNILKVIDHGRFIHGPEVGQLEEELTAYFGRPVVTVASGTDALTLALQGTSPDVKPTVVVPAFSFSATASAVLRAGFDLRFVDIDSETLCINWDQVRALDGPNLIVVPVHLYGRTITPPSGLKAKIVEDACQAFGAFDGKGHRACTLGQAAALSFFPSKPLGCYGDGGAVVCATQEVADAVRLRAHHGARGGYLSEVPGFNSRLDSIQAAVLLAKLRHVEAHRKRRAEIAAGFTEALEGIEGVTLPPAALGSAWSCYVVRIADEHRDFVLERLRAEGVDAVVQYPVPLSEQPAFRTEGVFPVAAQAAREVLGLPIYSGMTDVQVERVIEVMKRALKARSSCAAS